jgi:SMC interacting uncharacterized protein involved in chromosome segregation
MLQSQGSARNRGSSNNRTSSTEQNPGMMSGLGIISDTVASRTIQPSSEYSSILAAATEGGGGYDSEELNMSEINDDQEDVIYPKEVATNSIPAAVSSHEPQSKMRASESYLESSPTLRSKRAINKDGNVIATSPPTDQSASALSGYKTKVQQLIQKMEEQQAQHVREQDAKSLEFRRRMNQLLSSGDASKKTPPLTAPEDYSKGDGAMGEERTTKHANHHCNSPKNTTGDPQVAPYDINKTQTQCTASTRSISASSWSIASASKDEEDEMGTSHGQPQIVHVPHGSAAKSLEALQERLEKLEFEKTGLESENDALRSLRESYKRRFAAEQNERTQLQNQVTLLKSYLDDVQTMNRRLQADLEDSRTVQRKQRTNHAVSETEWKSKTDRVKRDLDKLWKEHKSSQTDLRESLQIIQDLQAQLDHYRKQERKWDKEKTFLKDKVKFLQGKISIFKATLDSVKEEREGSVGASED